MLAAVQLPTSSSSAADQHYWCCCCCCCPLGDAGTGCKGCLCTICLLDTLWAYFLDVPFLRLCGSALHPGGSARVGDGLRTESEWISSYFKRSEPQVHQSFRNSICCTQTHFQYTQLSARPSSQWSQRGSNAMISSAAPVLAHRRLGRTHLVPAGLTRRASGLIGLSGAALLTISLAVSLGERSLALPLDAALSTAQAQHTAHATASRQ